MAYIGKDPAQIKRALNEKDTFTGDGSTVAFDLTSDASGSNEIQVFVDNIRQEPGALDAYTLGEDGSGNLRRITFTAAPDSGAEIYVLNPKTTDSNLIVPSDNSVTSAKIVDGAIVNADINACAAISDTKLGTISTACKVATTAISQPGSSSVYLAGDGSWGAIDTSQQDTNAFNISLLGFKMAVNEGLTVFNLIDGVVDEFNDESGTDEAEGSNDLYCASSDYYINSNTTDASPIAGVCISAGFSTTAITEPDTSTAGTNPGIGSGTNGSFTVPANLTSLNFYMWGASGGTGTPSVYPSSGAGFSTGTLAVSPGQTIYVGVGEGGEGGTGAPGGSPFDGGIGLAVGGNAGPGPTASNHGSGAGGGSGIASSNLQGPQWSAPQAPNVIAVAAGSAGNGNYQFGGAGGGLTGGVGQDFYPGPATSFTAQTNEAGNYGGGGDQEQGGQGGANCAALDGAFMAGGNGDDQFAGGGGGGYYGGGGGSGKGGGGGSSYYGHPQITCGSTENGVSEGDVGFDAGPSNGGEPGGDDNPLYPQTSCAGNGVGVNSIDGRDGYVFLIGSVAPVTASTTSTTIVSEPFTSTSVPTSARIVVFEENVDTPTLNTDVIASISRDGGSTFTNATLTDSGYVTGSSGQRILTGQATISGQPSGQSMRWKLALANNTVKIHGVSLQWA
jgi:hypothetical protein